MNKEQLAAVTLNRNHIARLCELLAPALDEAAREAMAEAIYEAPLAPAGPGALQWQELLEYDLSRSDASVGALARKVLAWEALLEKLEQHRFLHSFSKPFPEYADEDCAELANRAGIEARYTPSDEGESDNLWEVLADFDNWLATQGYVLLWPQGSMKWPFDDDFPALIARADQLEEIETLVSALWSELDKWVYFTREP